MRKIIQVAGSPCRVGSSGGAPGPPGPPPAGVPSCTPHRHWVLQLPLGLLEADDEEAATGPPEQALQGGGLVGLYSTCHETGGPGQAGGRLPQAPSAHYTLPHPEAPFERRVAQWRSNCQEKGRGSAWLSTAGSTGQGVQPVDEVLPITYSLDPKAVVRSPGGLDQRCGLQGPIHGGGSQLWGGGKLSLERPGRAPQ